MKTAQNPKSDPSNNDPVVRAKEQAESIKDEAAEKLRNTGERVKEKSSELVAETKARLRENTEEAKRATLKRAENRKERLADHVAGYEKAAQAAVSRLKEENEGPLAEHIESAAAKIGDVSRYLSSHDVPELASDLAGFTRRHPEIVLGGTILAGFAVARFLKASSESDQRSRQPAHRSSALASARGPGVAESGPVTPGYYSPSVPGEPL